MRTAPLRTLASSCLFYEEFHWVLGTVSSTEPPMVHDSLVSHDVNLLTPESNIRLERIQQAPDQASEVTWVLTPVLEEALLLEHVLGLYSEEL
ncbi:unnamed protein product [Caretta caretta]